MPDPSQVVDCFTSGIASDINLCHNCSLIIQGAMDMLQSPETIFNNLQIVFRN